MSYWQRKEIEQLARLTGMESHPFIQRMVNSTMAPAKQETVEKVLRLLQKRAAFMVPNPHPFLPVPNQDEVSGPAVSSGLMIGGGNGPDIPFHDPLKSFLQHKGFFGPAGSGKTTLMLVMTRQAHELGLPVWWFDSEDEMAPLLADLDNILFIDAHDLRFNPFEAPPGCDPLMYIDKVVSRFRETLYFRDGSVNLTRSVCRMLVEQTCVCSVGDVYRTLLRMKFKVGQRIGGYWETCCNRFADVLSGLGSMVDVRHGHDIGQLLDKSVVWRVRGLSDDHLAFFISCLLLWVEQYREVQYEWELKNIFTFDELTRVSNVLRERRADIAEPFFYDFARTCRKRGIGLAVASQTPGLLPVSVLANLSTWYTFRPVDMQSTRVITGSMGLSQEQVEHFMCLRHETGRVAAVRHPGYPDPFLVHVPEWTVAPASADRVQQVVDETRNRLVGMKTVSEPEAAGVQAELPTEPVEPDRGPRRGNQDLGAPRRDSGAGEPVHPFNLCKRDLDYLQLVAETPFLAVTARDARYKLSAWMGNQVRRNLRDLNLVKAHRVNTGVRGKMITLLEVTERGYQVLDGLQVKTVRPKGNGGFIHRYWQHIIHTWAVERGYPAEIEQALQRKRVDVGIEWDEKKCAVEVVIKGLDKEVSNFVKDIEDGWDQVVFCAETQKTLDTLKKMIEEEVEKGGLGGDGDGHGKVDGRVAFMRLKEFIS